MREFAVRCLDLIIAGRGGRPFIPDSLENPVEAEGGFAPLGKGVPVVAQGVDRTGSPSE
jgi:hypothetical protein